MVNLLISQLRSLMGLGGRHGGARLVADSACRRGRCRLWGSWAARNRRTIGDGAELAGYARFREAMETHRSPELGGHASTAGPATPARPAARTDRPRRCTDRPVPYCRSMPRRTATMLASTLMLIALLCAGVLHPRAVRGDVTRARR